MVFEDIWRLISSYPQVFVPWKPYKHLLQVTGKEMRSILKIILAVFTTTLWWNNDFSYPSGGQEVEFKKAITCIWYLTDFGLIVWYASYTESTINYICNYLRRFHETNSVFLRFQAPKAARAKAEVVEQELQKQREARQQGLDDLSMAQYAQMHKEDQLEGHLHINQVLE